MRTARSTTLFMRLMAGGLALPTALALSAVINVALANEVHRCRSTLARPRLLPGARVPSFTAVSLAGMPFRVEYPSAQPTVLYYFSTTCRWCERNWSNVRTILEAGRGRFRMIGVSSSMDVEVYLRDRRIVFDVVITGLPEVATRDYRFTGTPQTVVVGTDGVVLASWPGAYVAAQASDIERYFGVDLPGLVEAENR
jgi:hypothetical protein